MVYYLKFIYMLWNTHYLKSSIYKVNIVSPYMGEGKAQLRKLHNFFELGTGKVDTQNIGNIYVCTFVFV